MGRKLPWAATSNTSVKPEATSSRPAKRLKLEQTTVKTESKLSSFSTNHASSPSTTTAKRESSPPAGRKQSQLRSQSQPRRQDRDRTRDFSSSPPPLPAAPDPQDLSPMRPGLDEDDSWMTVEDEFYTIAQRFTAHLHHAEYKRLMAQARERKRNEREGTVPDVPFNASIQTKQRLEREGLEKQQSSGVKSMLGDLSDGSDSDEEDEAHREKEKALVEREEARMNDPWAGTSIAGLMNWDSTRGKTSLKGLEGFSRETRAARGFGPTLSQKSEGRGKSQRDEAVSGKGKGKEREKSSAVPGERVQSRRNRVIDLDSDSESKSYASEGFRVKNDKLTEVSKPRLEPAARNGVSSTSSKPASNSTEKAETGKKPKSFVDTLDDFDEETYGRSQTTGKSRK